MKRGIFGVLVVVTASLVSAIATPLASAAPAKGAPIRIGAVCICSGAQGGGNRSLEQFDKAWVKWTNAHGGINGHPVKLYFADDAGDATKSATIVREMIAKYKIQAIAGYFSSSADSWAAAAKKAGIPVIGSPNQSAAEYTNSTFFPTGMNHLTASYAVINASKTYNERRIGVLYCAETPVCGQVTGVFGGISKLVGGGVEVVSSAKISGSAPSYAAPCLAAKNESATSAIVVSGAAVVTRALQGCAQQGWKPLLLSAGAGFGHNDASEVPGLRIALATGTLGVEDTSTPGGKLLHQIIDKYAPAIPKASSYNAGVSTVFASLEMFAKAAKKAKLTPASKPSAVANGLYGLKDETLGGMIAPITYTRGNPTFPNCWFYSTYNGKTWRNNTKPQCLTGAKLAGLKKAGGL